MLVVRLRSLSKSAVLSSALVHGRQPTHHAIEGYGTGRLQQNSVTRLQQRLQVGR